MVSDTEEESHGRMSLDRKVDMLGIHQLNAITQSKRRRSVDFERESKKQRAKLFRNNAAMNFDEHNLATED